MKNEKKKIISGYIREILPQSLNQKTLSNTHVVITHISDDGVIRIQN